MVNHHYHVFPGAATVLFSKQRLLNRLLITHDHRLYIEWPIDTASGKINWCQTWLGNTQGVRFSQLTFILENYLGATRRPRYIGPRDNGVAVYFYFNQISFH